MNKYAFALIVTTFSQSLMAQAVPEEAALPCDKHVQIESITKTVVRMTPFRGINLIFPFNLNDDATVYSLSSTGLWNYKPAGGGSLVPVFYSTRDVKFNTIQDFTISTKDHVFTIALVADPDGDNHCSNIVFNYSAEQLAEIKAKKDVANGDKFKNEYASKLANVDSQAEKLALKFVGDVALTDPSKTKIYEEKEFPLANGELVIYIDKILKYRRFSMLVGEISNKSVTETIALRDIVVQKRRAGSEIGSAIVGNTDNKTQLKPRASTKFVFSTLTPIPKNGAAVIVKTSAGEFTVAW